MPPSASTRFTSGLAATFLFAVSACASTSYRPKNGRWAHLVQRGGAVEVILPSGRLPADQSEAPALACSENAAAFQEARRAQSNRAKLFNILGGVLFISAVPPMIFWPLAGSESAQAEGSAADIVNAYNEDCVNGVPS